MAQILDTIDKIARDKQRDVLYITFHNEKTEFSDEFDWKCDVQRQKVISFLKNNNISYRACFPPQPIGGMLILASPYKGEVYVDVEYDEVAY